MKPALRLQSLGDLRLRGPEGDLLRHRRKELALLVVLAAQAPRPVRREEIQALFWGERDEKRARHSLRQALLRVRRACGDDVVEIGPDALRLANGGIAFDVREFGNAAAADRFREAIELWTGDFMLACEDVGGEEFATWFEAERERLRRVLYACFEKLAGELEAAGATTEMARWCARWVEQFGFDEQAAARHIEALCLCGKPAEAAAAQAAFAQRQAQQLDEQPDARWVERTNQLIAGARASAPDRASESTNGSRPATPQRRGTRKRAIAGVAVGIALAMAAWRVGLGGAAEKTPLILAVGHIETLGMPDSAAALSSLLAINLGRAPDLSILSEGRVQEVRVQLRTRGNVVTDLQRAARAAGADQIIEGIVARRPGGMLRLDLRRIDLASNASEATYTVEASDLFGLIDAAAERIARDLGVSLSGDQFGGTKSLAATRFYEEGLRAYYSGSWQAAAKLFGLSLAEDSTFAMAAYYLARFGGPNTTPLLRQARRMSQNGPDRDRLFIEAHWLGARDEPSQLAVAETLAIRYPAEPDAHIEYGRALIKAGRFLDAIPHYRRVVQMDSLGLRGDHARCLACDAYYYLIEAYRFADSLPATERVAQEWIARQPRSAGAWSMLSGARKNQGRYREAIEAQTTAARFASTNHLAVTGMMDLWMRMGDFESADRFWSGLLQTPEHEFQAGALSDAVLSLRIQGRFDDALTAAVRARELTSRPAEPLGDAFQHAALLYDLGRYAESAAVFDSLSKPKSVDSGARQGRNRSWYLAQAATAVAALGDSARLRRLEDTIRVQGARSGFRRDQIMHHYVRGLRLRLEGKLEPAADAFRRSLYSPVEGNTRAAVELARTLVDLKRPAEAVRVLRSAHWGPVGASGQYANRTDMELLYARAFEAANQPDSAMVHYAWVLNAWKNADPSLHAQRRDIQERVRRASSR